MNVRVLFEAATTAAAPEGNSTFSLISMLVMIGVVVLMMVFMSRKQKKTEKEAAEKRNSVEVGDEVTTIGGIVGRIVSLKEDTVVIETAGDHSRLRFKRWAIQEVDKLTLDTAATDALKDKASTDKK